MTDFDADEVRDRWSDYLYKPDGSLDEDKVLRELSDYEHVLLQVSEVYNTLTNGRLSKAYYYASGVISEVEELQEEYIREVLAEALDRIDSGETTNDLREEYEL